MEPVTAAALTTVLAGTLSGATGEAGAQAVQALRRLLQRAPEGHRDGLEEVERAIEGGEAEQAEAIARYLIESARDDAGFEHELRTWLAEASAARSPSVSNSITGPVHGNVIQAGVVNTDSLNQQ